MKKFILTTEYNQQELEQIIEQTLKRILHEELTTVIPQLGNSPPKKAFQNLLTRKEVAKMLRISYPTLLKLERRGLIKGNVISGSYRYTEGQISKFLEESKTQRQRA